MAKVKNKMSWYKILAQASKWREAQLLTGSFSILCTYTFTSENKHNLNSVPLKVFFLCFWGACLLLVLVFISSKEMFTHPLTSVEIEAPRLFWASEHSKIQFCNAESALTGIWVVDSYFSVLQKKLLSYSAIWSILNLYKRKNTFSQIWSRNVLPLLEGAQNRTN